MRPVFAIQVMALIIAATFFHAKINTKQNLEWQQPASKKDYLFHNNCYVEQFDPAYRKQSFYAITTSNGKKMLAKVKVNFVPVDDECIGQKVTYFRIPGNKNPDIPLLASDMFTQDKPLTSATYLKTKFMSVADKIDMNFLNENYTLYLKKNKHASDSLNIMLKYNNAFQTLNVTNLEEEYPPKIIFAGDLSGDEGLDLILQVQEKNGIYWILYISTAKPNLQPELKERARCVYTALPC